MPFDGAFLHCVLGEINAAKDAHIDKIYQPSKEELLLVLRKKGFVKKLLISAKSGMARLHFTENIPENPETPPMFCMLFRKHFLSARFLSAEMQGLERTVRLNFSGTNEMGDRVNIAVVCEFTGSANIILIGKDGRILDAVHRSDIEKDDRIIAPGAVYEYPKSQNKKNILDCDTDEILSDVLSCGSSLSSAFLGTVEGISPLVAREMAFLSCGDDCLVGEIGDKAAVKRVLLSLKESILSNNKPYIFYDGENAPKEFCFFNVKQYGSLYKAEECENYSSLLDKFYLEKEITSLRKRVGGDMEKLVKNLIARANKRMNLRKKELSLTADREKLRIYGELLKANIHTLKNGIKTATVNNFYDENYSEIKIPLDPSLSIQANAAKYFKDYKKSYNAELSLKELIKNDEKEIDYLESVAEELSRADTVSDINEIREELSQNGYIRTVRKNKKGKFSKPVKLTEYTSGEGYRIVVGKNNTQNDYITTVLAAKGDMWFHTKSIHGSHVIVMCGGKPLSDETVYFAAKLAAENSKAASSSNVPVDYTPVKYVKKPSGAKPGMVIYTTNKTIFVTPERKV